MSGSLDLSDVGICHPSAESMRLASFKVLDQRKKLDIVGIEGGEFVRVQKRCREIAAPSRERDEGDEDVAVRRMALVSLLEQLHCLRSRAGRIEGDRVDIGIMRIVGREFARLAQLHQCLGVILLAHQGEAE
jgi:hypothetical protein